MKRFLYLNNDTLSSYMYQIEGMPRPLAEYYKVTPNISFKEFNNYINSLDEKIISSRSK